MNATVLPPFEMPGCTVLAFDAGDDVRIERARQRSGVDLWAVRHGCNVLAKSGDWEWEPSPSSRDDDFMARCRFESPMAALACLREARSPHE